MKVKLIAKGISFISCRGYGNNKATFAKPLRALALKLRRTGKVFLLPAVAAPSLVWDATK